jgi:tetratricopeptide (TPR) repeat protein
MPGLALGLCALLALAVLFALPRLVRHPAPNPQESAPASVPAPTPAPPAPPADGVDTEARRSAQDALARVSELRAGLEAAAVTSWAAEPFAAALAEIERGAAAYRARDYAAAQAAYADAASRLADLHAQLEPRATQLLETGEAALAAGDGPAAQRSFAQVLAMIPGQPRAQAGLARVAVLPQVRELTARGQRLLESGDAAGAGAAFQAALALDAADPAAREGAARAAALGVRQRLGAVLDKGFAHLQAGRHQAAAADFERALQIAPDSREAREGLAEARNRARAARIQELLDEARQAAAAEEWHRAADRYRELLALDAGLVAARDGLTAAEARAGLDARLQATLADPQRLGSAEVQRAAQALLDEAGALPEPGPRLRGQLQALREALATARIPVPVALRSDGATRVTVLRVGALGAFENHRLELPPGAYVALGERPGYRDVRVRFEVRAGSPPPPVVVICRETI